MSNEVHLNISTLKSIPSLSSTSNRTLTKLNNVADCETWPLKEEYLNFYIKQFKSLQPHYDKLITGSKAKLYFKKSGLSTQELAKIWHLSDQTKDGALSLVEFIIAMHLIVIRKNDYDIPDKLPSNLSPLNIQKLISEHSSVAKCVAGVKKTFINQENYIKSKEELIYPQEKLFIISNLNKLPSSVRRSKTLPLNSLYIKQVAETFRQEDNNIETEDLSQSLSSDFKPGYKIVEKKQLHSCPDTFVTQHLDVEIVNGRCEKINSLKKDDDISTTLHFNCFVPTIPNDNEFHDCKTNDSTPPNIDDKENGEMNEKFNGITPANFDFLPVLPNQTNGLSSIHHPVAVKSSLDDHVPLVPPYASDDDDYDYLPASADEHPKDGNVQVGELSASSQEKVDAKPPNSNETHCTEEEFKSKGNSINNNATIKPLPPPFPLPRSKHGRSSSLDLNKLFAKTKDDTKASLSLLPPVIPPRLASPNPQLKKRVEFCAALTITKPNAQKIENGQNLSLDILQLSNLSDEAKLLIHQRTCSLDRKLPPSFAMYEDSESKTSTPDSKNIQSLSLKLNKEGLSGSVLANISKQNSLLPSSEDLKDMLSRHKAHNYLLMRLNAKLNHEKWKLAKRKLMLEEKLKSYDE